DDIPGGRDGFRNVGVRLQAHAEDTGVRRIAKDDQWRGALVHVVVDKVFYDPDDAVFFLAVIARDQAADNAVPADDMREAFVDDDAVAVLRGDLMKVPPRRKLHAHRGDVFGGGALDRDEDLFVRVFAGPLEIAGIAVQGQHGTAAQRRVLYVPGVDEVVANGFEMFAHLALELHIEQPFLFEPQLAVLDILQLPVNDDRGDDKDDGSGKLEDDEAFPDQDGAAGRLQLQALQYVHGVKGRKVKRGVGPGQEAAHPADRQQGEEMAGIEQADGQILIHEFVEGAKREESEADRDKDGKEGHEDGFPDELPDQPGPPRAQHLADTDFAGTFLRTGGGEVHAIDTGDEQDDPGDQRENAHVAHPAVRGVVFAVLEGAEEPQFGHREKKRLHDGTRRFLL